MRDTRSSFLTKEEEEEEEMREREREREREGLKGSRAEGGSMGGRREGVEVRGGGREWR